MKKPLRKNVLEAARDRIAYTFAEFDRVYVSFSGGKDSTVMVHLVADEARKQGKRFGLFFVDLEAQYAETIKHVRRIKGGGEMTREEKIRINRMLREQYCDFRNITYGDDHSVCCTVSDFPGSAKSQRVFAGWDGELLEEAKRREEA